MKIRRWCPILIAALIGAAFSLDGLTLPKYPPARIALDWGGMESCDGDGHCSFSTLMDKKEAKLKILCNCPSGYCLTFCAENAVSSTRSSLTCGNFEIPYKSTLLVKVKKGTVLHKSLDLCGQSPSLEVHFLEGRPPRESRRANEIRLKNVLKAKRGRLVPVGQYTDVITATVSVR